MAGFGSICGHHGRHILRNHDLHGRRLRALVGSRALCLPALVGLVQFDAMAVNEPLAAS